MNATLLSRVLYRLKLTFSKTCSCESCGEMLAPGDMNDRCYTCIGHIMDEMMLQERWDNIVKDEMRYG